MEHKKATILRDQNGAFIFADGTQTFTTIDTTNGAMEIPTGKVQWVCNCGKTNCEQMTD